MFPTNIPMPVSCFVTLSGSQPGEAFVPETYCASPIFKDGQSPSSDRDWYTTVLDLVVIWAAQTAHGFWVVDASAHKTWRWRRSIESVEVENHSFHT